jgi:hypothetical protein
MQADGWKTATTTEALETGPVPGLQAVFAAPRRTGASRYFFVGIGTWCILLAIVGFLPSFQASFAGEFHIPPIVHIHGAIMMGWLVLYTTQAGFAKQGNLRRHRQMGWLATGWAAAVWISMGVATVTALLQYAPNEAPFLVKPLLIQLGTMVVFPIFFIGAVLARRQAGWHKRLMTLATFVLVQAALDRMHWLPDMGLPGFWETGLRGYVLLLLPLLTFDLVTLRRIHPATLFGSGLIVAMHGVVSLYWADEGWSQLARHVWLWLR